MKRVGITWLIVPALLALMIALNPPNRQTYLMGDFRAFYCAGSAIAHGADPYREEPLRSCEAAAGPPAEPAFLRPVALPAPLPPYALLLFVPFSLVPFPLAAACWGVLLLACTVLSVLAFARATGATSASLNLAFAAITASVTLYVGQPLPLVFAALAAAALCARGGKWIPASACLALASIEPHVALAPIVALLVAARPARLPLVLCGLVLAALSVLGLGLPATLTYVREVLPAHALANAYEWQFSLTSLLTSLGIGAAEAVHLGEVMFAGMVLLGVVVALRLRGMWRDDALIVLVPPAFAVFGGVHVHYQQMAIAFPAIVYAALRSPQVRGLAVSGIALAMIPWNVLGTSVLAGTAPLLGASFAAQFLPRRRALALGVLAGGLVSSVVVLAALGFGPAPVHFVAHPYPPGALAESSWGEFSHAALMRPSFLMQWLRIPTFAGLGCGLSALVVAAFVSERKRSVVRGAASSAA